MEPEKTKKLRIVITENLRVQRGGADPVPYIDVVNVLSDAVARQNHAIFGRRGCGKTLLLHHSAKTLSKDLKPIYLNCEDFKKHSFPNVLIELLDALFGELEKHLTGWFGRKKRSRELVADIRRQLRELKQKEDRQEKEVRTSQASEAKDTQKAGVAAKLPPLEHRSSIHAA
jgi:Cdc6-like AAA superfamily ATPase